MFITNLKTINFMGKSIDEPISQKMIFIGENTSGKSMRSIAITLCSLGFIPFSAKPAKKAGDILRDFGDGEAMSIEITCGGHTLERAFSKNKKGVVSQSFKMDGRKRNKTSFEVELFKSGAPRIIDVQSFIKSSDTERISTLFALYPPNGDVGAIETKISSAKKKISDLNEKVNTADAAILNLTNSKGDIELPAGGLAETKKAIETLTDEIITAQTELKEEEIEQAKTAAIEQTKINVKKEREETQEKLNETMEDNTEAWTPSEPVGGSPSNDVEKTEPDWPKGGESVVDNGVQFTGKTTPETYYQNHTTCNKPGPVTNGVVEKNKQMVESIQKIIDAMKDSGCEMCAAGMVAKMELRKFR